MRSTEDGFYKRHDLGRFNSRREHLGGQESDQAQEMADRFMRLMKNDINDRLD